MTRSAHKVDPDLTRARGFSDRRSYVTLDGKEFLFGVDVGHRRNEVYERDRGICQLCGSPVAMDYWEMDHRLSRGKGGDDSLGNLRVVHSQCHKSIHFRPM